MAIPEPSWEALLVLAFIMIDSDEAEKALSILKGMQSFNERDSQVHKLMAYAYSKRNMPNESLRYSDLALQSDLPDEDIKGMKVLRARSLAASGDVTAAEDLIEHISRTQTG